VGRIAVRRGDLEMLQWAFKNGCPFDEFFLCLEASCRGHIHIVEWFRENEKELQEE
jgi:hypothetical protein